MVTTKRETYSQAFYHVYARGARRLELFHDSEDFKKILYIFSDAFKKFNFIVYSFCLMNNHYHFLIETNGEKDEVSNLMRYVNSRFAIYVNKKLGLSGHVFEDRFQSKVAYDLRDLLRLIKYIERNPVKAHIVDRCEDWKWSSSSGFLRANFKFDFLSSALINKFFQKEKNIRKSFLDFINFKDEEADLFDPLNLNRYMIYKINQFLEELKQEENFNSRIQQLKLKALLIKEMTSLTSKEILLQLENKLSEVNVRKFYSRVTNKSSAHAEKFRDKLKEFRMRMASQLPQGKM